MCLRLLACFVLGPPAVVGLGITFSPSPCDLDFWVCLSLGSSAEGCAFWTFGRWGLLVLFSAPTEDPWDTSEELRDRRLLGYATTDGARPRGRDMLR